MTPLEVNIGLDGAPDSVVGHSLMGLRYLGLVRSWEIHGATEDREETLAVRIFCNQPPDCVELVIHNLAERLNQEAIAIYYPEKNTGQLIGPAAEKWGTFDRNLFVTP